MEATWWTKPEQLDAEQRDVIALPLAGNHLVLGPPGSGKTNLLLLRASYLQANGINNFQLLTVGRVLREFLARGSETTKISANKIDTFVGWGSDVLDNCGVDFRVNAGYEEQKNIIVEKLTALDDEQVDDHRLDAILLDECQDYSVQEVNIAIRFSNRIFAAGDSRQRIYKNRGSIDRLRQVCPAVNQLTYHYRNGIKICRVADGITGLVGSKDGLEATSQYKELEAPSQVAFFEPESIQDQVSKAVSALQAQLRAYPTGMLGVLCPLNKDVREVWSLLSTTHLRSEVQLQMRDTGYDALDPDRRILVGSIHGAKGLEFRALHLLAMEGISSFPTNRTRLAYTGVTRAKTSLTIYRGGPLIGPLQNGEAALAPPPTSIDLKSLFNA
ncbi:ATP-binding domain-containing protein [Mesorhizobium sp. M0207]|uniref:ATP-binding domain-containing protein n=1 Tax=Mesorhizobium sp. M0207 TaxID=2956915 RepID=UPI00333D6DAC